MKEWFVTVLFIFFTGNFLFAQQSNLEIQGNGSNLFLEHKVAPKESLYSLGRLYNVSPKELAAFNHLQPETGLVVDQNLKIPLGKNNFTQSEVVPRSEALIPVYHTVTANETLYRLGINYNKVPLTSLKKWNHLPSDAVSAGTAMIVGFIKVDKNQSALAAGNTRSNANVAIEKEAKPVEKKVDLPAQNTTVSKEPEPVKSENKDVSISQTEAAKVPTKSSINFSGGYFKILFDQQVEKKSSVSGNGSAGIFKSTSGWQDGKYYCFNNTATQGTVLKVTDNTTGRSVYAKVLDGIPDIRQNSGLLLIISNAAAEELGAEQGKFDCTITYSK